METERATAEALREITGSQAHGRRIGDVNSWVLSLDTSAVTQPETPIHVLEYSGFSAVPCPRINQPGSNERLWEDFGRSLCYDIHSFMLESDVLRYFYAAGPISKLMDVLVRHATGQICKLNHDILLDYIEDHDFPLSTRTKQPTVGALSRRVELSGR